ncbi:chromate efflux transporter [Bacillaceae bacterium W0354]
MKKLNRYTEIFLVALRLGLTSFGGPVAHLAYFQEEYVKRRKWLTDQAYADLIALCQFLPGPASSQVGISIGMIRGGMIGGILAWVGFTLPSVILLILFAYYVMQFDVSQSLVIHSLKIVAVAVVLHAILNMGKKLTPDLPRISFAVGAAVLILITPYASMQIVVIIIAGIFGWLFFKNIETNKAAKVSIKLSKKIGVFSFVIFFGLLSGLPILSQYVNHLYIQLFDTFYRVGSLVFAGGHVVLPLLEKEVVPSGLLTDELFLAGYGAAQAVPGPLFTFSSYIGAAVDGVLGAVIATIAIFLPSFLLLTAVLPFWNSISKNKSLRAAFIGINAAVVGILIAAFYEPIFTSGIQAPVDFAVALISFSLLQFWKRPAWLVVILTVVLYVAINQFL